MAKDSEQGRSEIKNPLESREEPLTKASKVSAILPRPPYQGSRSRDYSKRRRILYPRTWTSELEALKYELEALKLEPDALESELEAFFFSSETLAGWSQPLLASQYDSRFMADRFYFIFMFWVKQKI